MGIPFPNIGEEPVRRNFEDVDERVDATNAAIAELEEGLGSALPVGSIVEYGGTAAPTGWMICDGTAISRTTYADLFTALGTAFGTGDGSTTFNLPDLRGRTPYGKGTNTDNDTLGESDGVAEASRTPKTTLSTSQIPSHSHAVSGTGQTYTGSGAGFIHGSNGTAGTGSNPQGATTGGGGSHNHGFLVVNFIIKALASGDGSGGTSGPAGGVLSGTFPNPGFAMDMATQAELDAAVATKQPLDSDLTTIAGLTPPSGGVLAGVAAAWQSMTYAALKTAMAFVKGDVGLGNVDNTSDANKPVSTATQTALDLKADDADVVHDTGNESVDGDKIWSGQQDYNGLNYFNAGIISGGADQFVDATILKLRGAPSTIGYDWMNVFLGIPNTFSTNARTSGNVNFTTDTALTGLTPSATTYAVNAMTGEIVAMTAHLGGDVNFTIARGQLTGIGGAAAAAIAATDVWYLLPYGQYAWDHAAIISGGSDYDTILLQGVGTFMPLEVKLADITTYNTGGRNLNFLINPDEWGLAPMNVSYAGGAFTQDFTATSGYKSMYLTAAPGGADYIIIGAY